VQADGAAVGEALVEVVALHHAGHGVLGRQLDHAARAQLVAPLAVVAHLGAGGVQHLGGLGVVGLGVDLDLLGRQRRARAVAARRIADQGGEVADQEDHLVAQVLQLAHLVEHHGVAQMDVGRRRVQAQLDAQRHAGGLGTGQLLHPVRLGQQLIHAAQGGFKRLAYTVGDRVCCNSRLIHKGFSPGRVGLRRYTPGIFPLRRILDARLSAPQSADLLPVWRAYPAAAMLSGPRRAGCAQPKDLML